MFTTEIINESNLSTLEDLEKQLSLLGSKLKKTIKNVKNLRENCQSTTSQIMEINNGYQKRK